MSLNKSTKPAATQASASSPIAGGAESDGCPVKRAPNFEIVMFFEGAEVPASVEDISVQPAAGAQPSSGGTTASTDPSQQPQGTVASPRRPPIRLRATAPPRPPRPREGGAAQ